MAKQNTTMVTDRNPRCSFGTVDSRRRKRGGKT